MLQNQVKARSEICLFSLQSQRVIHIRIDSFFDIHFEEVLLVLLIILAIESGEA